MTLISHLPRHPTCMAIADSIRLIFWPQQLNFDRSTRLGTHWAGFSYHCHWRFSLKLHADSKLRKCPFLQEFRARDVFWGRPVVSSLWPRFEPFGVPRGVYRVPWFRRHQSAATRKSPEFPRRNAKTRWGEPAGHFASSHLAVASLVEAVSWTRNGANFQNAEINWQTSSFRTSIP